MLKLSKKELAEIMSAIGCAISELETRSNPCTEWKALEEKISKYLAKKQR